MARTHSLYEQMSWNFSRCSAKLLTRLSQAGQMLEVLTDPRAKETFVSTVYPQMSDTAEGRRIAQVQMTEMDLVKKLYQKLETEY